MERDREREELLNSRQNLENWENLMYQNVCPRLAAEKKEFKSFIVGIFRPFCESGRQENNFEWGCVKNIYNVIKNDLNCIWSLRIACNYALELFGMFNCEDHPLIAKVLYIYHQVLNEYENGIFPVALCANFMEQKYPRHYLFEERKGTSSILSTLNTVTGRTYRFTDRELYSKLTIRALHEGDYFFLKFLVKYGLSYYPNDEQKEAERRLKRLKYAYEFLKSLENHDNEIGERNLTESVITQLLTDVENKRRLILIVRYLNICLQRHLRDNYYEECVKCLELYVLTLSEPEISMKDLEDFLNLVFSDDRGFITQMCSVFLEDVFKDSPSLSSPRALQHLCRCTLRDAIQRRSLLPSVFSDMHIPTKIKDYLLIVSD